MYEWIPKRTNQTARNLIFLLFGGAAALLLVTFAVPDVPFRWVFQIVAVGLFTAAVFLVTRYITKQFTYRLIKSDEGGTDFTVTESASGGKRPITVCRIGTEEVVSVRLLDMADGGESERFWNETKKKRGKIFDYCPDFHPVQSMLVTVREGGELLMLRLAVEPELFAFFEQAQNGGNPDESV